MNTAELFLSAFRRKQAQAAQQEAGAAADLRLHMQGLVDQPGWKILVDHLTQARDVLYRKMENGTATDADRAFAKLARQLCDGPAAMIEAATVILRDAATPQ